MAKVLQSSVPGVTITVSDEIAAAHAAWMDALTALHTARAAWSQFMKDHNVDTYEFRHLRVRGEWTVEKSRRADERYVKERHGAEGAKLLRALRAADDRNTVASHAFRRYFPSPMTDGNGDDLGRIVSALLSAAGA